MRHLTVRSILALAATAIAALTLVQLAAARIDRGTRATATTIQVRGGEFFFRLYLCTVPGHAAAGMKGVFTVR